MDYTREEREEWQELLKKDASERMEFLKSAQECIETFAESAEDREQFLETISCIPDVLFSAEVEEYNEAAEKAERFGAKAKKIWDTLMSLDAEMSRNQEPEKGHEYAELAMEWAKQEKRFVKAFHNFSNNSKTALERQVRILRETSDKLS